MDNAAVGAGARIPGLFTRLCRKLASLLHPSLHRHPGFAVICPLELLSHSSFNFCCKVLLEYLLVDGISYYRVAKAQLLVSPVRLTASNAGLPRPSVRLPENLAQLRCKKPNTT